MEPAAWLDAARDRYLQLRGSGLVLSSLDADRLRAWRDRGIPLDLVLHGLELAHAAWVGAGRGNASRPFPLWSAERHVEELARGWERRTPSGPSGGAGGRPGDTLPGGSERHSPIDRAVPAVSPAGSAASARPIDEPPGAIGDAISRLERLLGTGANVSTRRETSPAGLDAPYVDPAAQAYRAALAALFWADRVGAEESRALLLADEAAGVAFVVALPRSERRNVVSGVMRRAGPRGAATRSRHRSMLRALLAEAAFRSGGLERPSDP